MRLAPALAVVSFACWVLAGSAPPVNESPSDHDAGHLGSRHEVLLCQLKGIRQNMHTFVPPPPEFRPEVHLDALVESKATITVNYTGFSAEAKTAFEYALGIWRSQLTSSGPIVVNASFKDLGSGTLAQASATYSYRDFPGAAWSNTWFGLPLANKRYGADLDTGNAEISAEFSSSLGGILGSGWWYYGTDGKPPAFHYDFVSTVLHEIGHGLEFSGTAFVNKKTGLGYYGSGAPPYPSIYDRFVVNGSLQPILSFASGGTALAGQLQGRSLYWSGINGRIGAGGAYPRLYAPSEWDGGSSYSHLNESTYPAGNVDDLMTPQAGWAEATHDPGPIMRGILLDMGWDDTTCAVSVSPTTVNAGAAGGKFSVDVTTTLPGCGWTAGNPVGYSWFQFVTSSTGTGSKTFEFNISANSGPARSGAFVISGKQVNISQASGYTAPVVTTHPSSQTRTSGQTASFTAAASGTPTPTVQWQVSTNGGTTYSNISGATGATYSFSPGAADNGKRYRAVFTNSAGSATTNAAILTVHSLPSVTTNPVSQTRLAGQTAIFTAAATGNPTPTVQWQVSTNGGSTWSNVSGATGGTYSFTAAAGDTGKRYRALFTNSVGSQPSTAATLTVTAAATAPAVTTHPANQTVAAGQTASFDAAASGSPSPTVQWQVSTNGGSTYSNISGATATTYSFATAAGDTGKRFRAVFTNSAGSATTNAATLTVTTTSTSAPGVTTQPANQTVAPGGTATFAAAASGTPTPTVQWQISTNGGTSWSPVSGATSTTYSRTAAASDHGSLFRAVFTNSAGSANTNAAMLGVFGKMQLNPSALKFSAIKAGATGGVTGSTGAQTVSVTFDGAGSAWTATADQPWIEITGGSGTGAGQFTVAIVNPGNVLGGSTAVTGTVTINAPASPADVTGGGGVAFASLAVPVSLAVDQSGGAGSAAAFGQVDTPAQNAVGVQGAIGVTGWVLDDIGVTGVKIYRNCLPFDNPASCEVRLGHNVVFIGDAAFVAGARPDVETAFATMPQAYRAGWGYLMLTNMLPHVPNQLPYGGQGALTLFAIASDVDGHQTLLGRSSNDSTPTSITMANDSIAKPFGAIDTPGQGQTVSGSLANFGWALSRDGDTTAGNGDTLIPTNGSTMVVFLDGLPIAQVAYNQCRGTVGNPVPGTAYCDDDVSNIFGNPAPQPTFTARTANPTRYRNLDAGRAAIGAHVINTTTLANGMHSIAWSVTDSAGMTEGIGSRNFTVLNSGADQAGRASSTEEQVTALLDAPAMARGEASSLADLPPASSSVRGRLGFNLGTPLENVVADEEGVRHIVMPDVSRLELDLGPVDLGYLVANGTLRDLPPGSTLDATAGVFAWMPATGYLGTYRFVFLRGDEQIPVDVTIRAAATSGHGEAEIRMVLDGPRDGETVTGPLRIGGWALDPQAWTGSGIETVQVWAARTDVPGDPVLLGDAAMDGVRPDVVADHGPQFVRAGFTLTTAALAPGDYAITAYAWNRRTARWEDARSVSVHVR